jgi:hypothetical protein
VCLQELKVLELFLEVELHQYHVNDLEYLQVLFLEVVLFLYLLAYHLYLEVVLLPYHADDLEQVFL